MSMCSDEAAAEAAMKEAEAALASGGKAGEVDYAGGRYHCVHLTSESD